VTVLYETHASPVGELLLVGTADHLAGLYFPRRHPPGLDRVWTRSRERFANECSQLDAFFARERRTFDIVLRLDGTPFQRAVWTALLDIGWGTTTTYTAIARTLGRPRAARAVGAAVGRNPISIVVPCHRVLGAGGSLTGYGGGLEAKRWLLRNESTHDHAAPYAT
jgi:methylated-DNA-[protein]-cysteine S-methyltransferase